MIGKAWQKFRDYLSVTTGDAGRVASDAHRGTGSKPVRNAAHAVEIKDEGAAKLVANFSKEAAERSVTRPEMPTQERGLNASSLNEEFPDRNVPLVEHLSPEIDTIIRRYEPVLAQRILDLTTGHDAWEIRYGERGSGTWTKREDRVINIDGGRRGQTLATLSHLIHEVKSRPSRWLQTPAYEARGQTR
ncbi:hypothetical protein [Nocardia sp. NPDC049149]|uniref:hypothetical protein n=1 Tax=Nocardia sp. NPDC049149 TaxID=3364315 RepID=UPI003717C8BE